MKRTLAVVVATVALSAQSKPNFSGNWMAIPDPKAAPAPANPQLAMLTTGAWGNEFKIAQDDKTLVVTRSVRGSETIDKFSLDGAPVKSEAQGQLGGPTAITSTAKWQGNKLVLDQSSATNMMGNNITMGVKVVLSLEKDGTMTMETTRSGGAIARPPVVTKYKKGT
jgi:hypothetical protein